MHGPLLSTPPLDAVRGFVAVARRMSITLAARDLCLTQSAVSRQIQSLEQHFGVPLLVRKHRAIELTDTGEQLLRLAGPWLDRLLEFSQTVRQEKRPKPVTISSSIGATSLWMLPRLGAFLADHPRIDVRVATNNRLVDLDHEGIDLALRYCRDADAPEGAARLFGEHIVPVASKAVAERAFRGQRALFDEVFLELDERTRPWLRWSDWFGASGFPKGKPKGYLHFNQYDQLIQAAIQGHGIALGRVALVQAMLHDGRLVAWPDSKHGQSDYGYWLVSGSGTRREEVDLFRGWLLKEARETAERVEGLMRRAAAVAPRRIKQQRSG